MELLIKQLFTKIINIISKHSYHYTNSISFMFALIYIYINYHNAYIKYIKNNLYNITIKFDGFVTSLLGKMRGEYSKF